MDTRTYKASPDQLQAIAEKLQANGFAFNPNQPTGETSARGFDIQWSINSDAATIAVTVVKHPFGEEGLFWSHVQEKLGDPVGA